MTDDDTAAHATFASALAVARPTARELGRQLRLRQVLSGVLGVERELPRLDRYEVVRRIGAGGMGVVYQGRELDSGRAVAIKMIEDSAGIERARFAREVTLLRGVSAPGVCAYLDHGTSPAGQAYLVMEWIDGEDLAARLRREPLDVTAALRIGLGIAQAMAGVHAAGIVHRDLKPSNVMLVGGRVDDVRVIDFGIARGAPSGSRLTATGAVVGTPHYMAPEQLRGEAEVRTDLYGLGATLFEAVAGRPVFVGAHPGAVMLAVLAEPPPSLSVLRPEVSGAVDALIGRLLAKSPDDRPADMASVATEIAQLISTHRAAAVLSRAERLPPRAAEAPATGAAGPPIDADHVIGRAHPLAQIAGLLADVAEEEMAAMIAVSGEPGIGKSAVLAAAVSASPGWRCLQARASRDQRGTPFGVLRALVSGQADADTAPFARALELGAATDPVLHGDRVLLAWLDRLELWTSAGPVVVVVDDADQADLSSIHLLARALDYLRARPFALIISHALGQPPAIAEVLGGPRAVAVRLGPLGSRAAGRLAARWAAGGEPAALERVVATAAGNPTHLRELCRELARSGASEEPRSVAELLWQRLERLAPEIRRTLRAASIIGRRLWVPVLEVLLGVPPGDAVVARHIAALVGEGYLRPSPGQVAGHELVAFTSELAYLAAYELTGDDERRAGHREVADWLALHAPDEDALRALHLDAAGLTAAAARHHLAAARGALAGGDSGLFEVAIQRAGADEAPAEVRGEALALRGQARFWAGAIREALELGAGALTLLDPGSVSWFNAASLVITAAGQTSDHGRMLEVAELAASTAPHDDEAARRQVVTACRALSQLGPGRTASDRLRSAASAVPASGLGPEGRAWRARARAQGWAAAGFDAAIGSVVEAHRAHVEHGDQRSAALMGIYLCSYYVWSGGWERAREVVNDALRVVRRLDVGYLELWARYAEAKLLVEIAPFGEAQAALDRVIDGTAESPRIRAGAQIYAAMAAARAGRFELAVAYARAAHATHTAPLIALVATAAEVRGLLGQGLVAAAAARAEVLRAHDGAEDLAEFDELVRLARAEAAWACGERGAAAAAAEAVMRRAATLGDPLRRNEYLARPHLVVQILTLAGQATDAE